MVFRGFSLNRKLKCTLWNLGLAFSIWFVKAIVQYREGFIILCYCHRYWIVIKNIIHLFKILNCVNAYTKVFQGNFKQ